jgi:photosystem II stability/assembly factor-like uncharacterized protein
MTPQNDVKALTALNQRVWYVEGGVHPTRAPVLLAVGKISTDPSQSIGEDTRITAPDPNSFNRDIPVGTVRGAEERATLSVAIRYTVQADILLGWKNRRCRVDIFALSGRCGNPQDFTEGGEKWTYFPDGRISNHGYENFGAFGNDENNPTNSMVDMSSEEYYEFLQEKQEAVGGASTVREIWTVDVYTGNECENCPDPCDRVLATMAGTGATPGTQPVLLYSADGGETWSSQTISTLFSTEDIADGVVIGQDIVYVSNIADEIHWTDIEQLYNGTNTWSQVPTGFVKNKGPHAISSADARHTWIVGDGGYIYFCKNHKVGVEVQDAGVLTTQNLLDVHAYDNSSVLAVGNSNAVVFTTNGITWQTVTGPAVGVNLATCWMWDRTTWFVGEGAGGTGKVWLTTNSGKTWSQVGLPGTYLRIDQIKFISEAEGYMLVRTGGTGLILRTITAGNEWVVLPQGKSAVYIENAYLNDIGVCSKYANTVFAGGLADNGTAGVILKSSG